MVQFVAFNPGVEVSGAAIAAMTAGLGDAIKPLLAVYGLENFERDGWYSQQSWLDVFKAIDEHEVSATFDLVSIGIKIPESALFPAEIDSIPSALAAIDVAYHMNHRGGEIGHYQARVVSDSHIIMTCDNPYPCDFDYGIIYSMTRRFCPPGCRFVVRHEGPGPCRKQGDDSCIYHVTWPLS